MIFVGDLVYCPALGQLEILRDQLLVVNEPGFITYRAPAALPESIKLIDSAPDPPVHVPTGSFLLPTFCDLHLHAPQFLYQGTGLHLPLMEWLDEYAFKAEERIDADPALAERVYKRLAARLIEHGTGAVLLFGTIKAETNLILAKAMQEAGVRASVGKLSMDISSRPTYVEDSAAVALSSVKSFCERCSGLVTHLPDHERLIEPVLTPRFVPTCSDELLKGLGDLAMSKQLRIQSHMAESHDQMAWVQRERGLDDMEVFKRSNLLTSRTVQAHCTYLDPPSLEQLAQSGTAVAHCPQSNAYFSARPFRLREALQLGVKVGLGTDIAGGYSIDIMSAMRQTVMVSRMREGARLAGDLVQEDITQTQLSVDWKEALYLATRGGAIALGMHQGSGTFTVGAPFDAQRIKIFDNQSLNGIGPLDLFDEDVREVQLTVELLEKWWCIGDVRNRNGMWVQGKKVVSLA